MVDIDEAELHKPTVSVDMRIHADVADVMKDIAIQAQDAGNHREWLGWCRRVNAKYPAALPSYFQKQKPLNPYAFIQRFSECLEEGDPVICGNGSACVITFRLCRSRRGRGCLPIPAARRWAMAFRQHWAAQWPDRGKE